MPIYHKLTQKQINLAHKTFLKKEPRDLFYRAATYLVNNAYDNQGELSLAEAVSVLLQTWNRAFYIYRHKFDNHHFKQIEQLVSNQYYTYLQYRTRKISSLKDSESPNITFLFHSFELVLGPVGAAKTLHLLAPHFFPIWDRTVAKAYGLSLTKTGTNKDKFFEFMKCQKEQANAIVGNLPDGLTAIKAIDEYNYCHFTKEWI